MTNSAAVFEQVERPIRAYDPEAVLNIYQVAEWLQVSYKKVEDMPIKSFWIGNRRRYLGKHILEFIEEAAK